MKEASVSEIKAMFVEHGKVRAVLDRTEIWRALAEAGMRKAIGRPLFEGTEIFGLEDSVPGVVLLTAGVVIDFYDGYPKAIFGRLDRGAIVVVREPEELVPYDPHSEDIVAGIFAAARRVVEVAPAETGEEMVAGGVARCTVDRFLERAKTENICHECGALGAVMNRHRPEFAQSDSVSAPLPITWKCAECNALVCFNCALTVPGSEPLKFYDETFCSDNCRVVFELRTGRTVE